MSLIKIGYDDNLGIPSDFAQHMACEVIAYHDLFPMITDFMNQNLSAIFIPAGTLPYVKNYSIISQSLFGPQLQSSLETRMVTTKTITAKEIPHSVLGRVNPYCTTSFWAPLIYLMNILPKGTTLNFKNTLGFIDMLDKVAADMVDAAMVWDIIVEQNPDAASKVHTLFRLEGLPTPIIIANDNLPLDRQQSLQAFKTQDKASFFQGFQAPDKKSLEKFQLQMAQAQQFFKLNIL